MGNPRRGIRASRAARAGTRPPEARAITSSRAIAVIRRRRVATSSNSRAATRLLPVAAILRLPPGGGYTPPGGGYTPPPGGGYSPPPAGPGYTAGPVAGGGTNPMAIIALVLSIIALLPLCTIVFGFGSIILGLAAVVVGYLGMTQARQRGQGGRGLAIAGIIVGALAAILGLLETAGCGMFSSALGTIAPQLMTNIPLTLTATGQ